MVTRSTSRTGLVSFASDIWRDRWLLEAFRRAEEPLAEKAAQLMTDTAWEALLGAGVPADRVLDTACAMAAAPAARLADVGPEHEPLLPRTVAYRYGVSPVRMDGNTLEVVTSNPLQLGLEEDLAFASGRRVRLSVAGPADIRDAMQRVYPETPAVLDAPEQLARIIHNQNAPQGAAVELANHVLGEALNRGASDIHIEPRHDGGLLVRFRVDGVLQDALQVPAELASSITSRLKVTANLDISDRVRPQDGRASTMFAGRSVDLRVSTLPLGGMGEKIVIRVLDSKVSTIDLGALGFTPAELHRFQRMLAQPEGMILVTGPTGSGKTTTLYSALRFVQSPANNIVTVEDPIEYRLPGINQVQTNDKAGLDFAAALRSILRQDPDVVLVGEVRDRETSDIAVKASMTGHLVLSTLHTNDAISAVSRLTDIGVDTASLSAALKCVVAQRLVRRLCKECGKTVALADLSMDQQRLLFGKSAANLRQAVGCRACRGTGYRGRMVVAEVLIVTPDLQRAIARGADVRELIRLGAEGGMRSLWDAGIDRVVAGATSLHELLDNVAAPIGEGGETGGGTQADVDALLATLLGPKGSKPAPAAGAASDGGQGQAHPTASASAPRVLLVDDDRMERQNLKRALERDGYRVIEAADGEAGMLYARRLKPEYVICELVLPRLDGIALIQSLMAEAEPPVVLVRTAQGDASMLEWARELGASEAMAKSIDLRTLCSRLRELRRSSHEPAGVGTAP
jgi:type II secretory ATPase GspE/PulE/Tfp pilus assembly ATPase PilB-like protein/ActR/RegA family two-component response regulator